MYVLTIANKHGKRIVHKQFANPLDRAKFLISYGRANAHRKLFYSCYYI